MREIPFLPELQHLPGASIKVVGVGGAGCNAINRMVEGGVSGVELIAMNTDQQCLGLSQAHVKLPLGPQSSRGLGAGGNSERGEVAAEESREEILAALRGADMVFIAAGMGGGTGTGAAPVVASCARELGALSVAVVCTPFQFEGRSKGDRALQGLDNLRGSADTVIVVANERLKGFVEARASLKDMFRAGDSVLIQGVRGIADLNLKPGIMNADFADVEAILRDGGEALIGTGQGRGEEAVLDALKKALACPLLERAQTGAAHHVIVSIVANWDQQNFLGVETAMNFLQDHYHGVAEIKMGTVDAPDMEDRVQVTVLASGFDDDAELGQERRQSLNLETGHPIVRTGPIYGEVPDHAPAHASSHTPTPTRLLPQGPTPSGEVASGAEDLHVPAIIRQAQGRLPIE